jgi:SRSO17 transposase
LGEGRKNVERMALRFSEPTDGGPVSQKDVVALQRFLTDSPWDHGAVQRELQAQFAEELVPSTASWSIGTVGVIDESGFVKRGTESVGVKRQWCGRLGKEENCQVGVFLVGVTPSGTALLDHQLYLPQEWAQEATRREETRVPSEVAFQTKPQIAATLLARTRDTGHVRFDWVIADETYGQNGEFLDALEAAGQRYVVEVPVTTTVWTVDPAGQIPPYGGTGRRPSRPRRDEVRSVKQVADALPPDAWRAMQLREGAKGPLVFEFAAVRVWSVRHRGPGPAVWLVLRRSLGPKAELQYYISNADEQTPLEEMALVTGSRWRVEEFFEDGKGDFGMADYESRSWTSWHHHMSLVALAHLFVTLTKLDLKRDAPELTLPLAMELLKAAFQRPVLSYQDAQHLTEYHLTRNRVARRSHRKSWRRKHKKVKPKVLL